MCRCKNLSLRHQGLIIFSNDYWMCLSRYQMSWEMNLPSRPVQCRALKSLSSALYTLHCPGTQALCSYRTALMLFITFRKLGMCCQPGRHLDVSCRKPPRQFRAATSGATSCFYSCRLSSSEVRACEGFANAYRFLSTHTFPIRGEQAHSSFLLAGTSGESLMASLE